MSTHTEKYEVSKTKGSSEHIFTEPTLSKGLECVQMKSKNSESEKNNEWKQELREMKLKDTQQRSPAFFQESGGFKMKIIPYKDTTANGLTRAIIDWLTFSGHYANRINVQGQVRKERIELAQGNHFDKISFTPSTTTKGTADISAIVAGRHWSIEVKINKDRMSLNQLKEMERVTKAGGKYFVARDMPSFIKFYKEMTVNNK